MEENMNLDQGRRRLQYDFVDFMGVGAQKDDDEINPVEHELDPELQENMSLDSGSLHSFSFIDFMGLDAQHDDDDSDDDQEPDPAQVHHHHHHHQRDSTCTDVKDALLEDMDGVSSPVALLPTTGKVERNLPEDREVRVDPDMRRLPEISITRLLREEEGSQFLTLRLGPTWDTCTRFGPCDLGP